MEPRSTLDVTTPDGRSDVPLYVVEVFLRHAEHDPHAIINCKRLDGSNTYNCCRKPWLRLHGGYLLGGDARSAAAAENARSAPKRPALASFGDVVGDIRKSIVDPFTENIARWTLERQTTIGTQSRPKWPRSGSLCHQRTASIDLASGRCETVRRCRCSVTTGRRSPSGGHVQAVRKGREPTAALAHLPETLDLHLAHASVLDKLPPHQDLMLMRSRQIVERCQKVVDINPDHARPLRGWMIQWQSPDGAGS